MIEKRLKFGTFVYDESLKEPFVIDVNGKQVALNKVYAYALTRFILRISQRNWYRKYEKPNK